MKHVFKEMVLLTFLNSKLYFHWKSFQLEDHMTQLDDREQ